MVKPTDKKKLLIVNPAQFGYGAGYHYYCKNLKDAFDIDFLCIDKGFTKIDESKINIIYWPDEKNRLKRLLGFIYHAVRLSWGKKYDVVFCVYFRWVYLLGLFCRGDLKILDIRTVSLSDNALQRFLYNGMNLFSCLFFGKITTITKSIAELLKLPSGKTFYLPLGATTLDDTVKNYDKTHLLYIGTLHNRQIEKTIEGFVRFYKKYKNAVSLRYDIIGFSHDLADEKRIVETIEENNLNSIVVFHGRKNHLQVKEYIQKATIGVCFVPQKPYYDVQPPTKIFEYVLSGLITIATNTKENRRLITDINGVICEDNADSFCAALEKIYANLDEYNDRKIRDSLNEYNWENIVKNVLLPILEK